MTLTIRFRLRLKCAGIVKVLRIALRLLYMLATSGDPLDGDQTLIARKLLIPRGDLSRVSAILSAIPARSQTFLLHPAAELRYKQSGPSQR